ncbi:molybdate ABC transporter substrate-binding protein [Plastoroseomonas arctica]|uniref:ABC transporter substrate-binding protein n=1 Tax=Plastoroseomonas arctica TaxID=1509237 RepID=A0AAF1KKM8_9PROT|nr:substrate-binding domain-containing protein [Plastoroseomonas arctica]MBR0656730.1 ABC transporter substrate-binding protein [Plastoroseomonas arctica]
MMMTRRAVTSLAAALPVTAAAQSAPAIFAAGAVKTAVEALLAELPEPPTVRFATVGALRDEVLAGARPRLVLLSEDALVRLDAAGLLLPGSRRSIGRTGVALATRAGAALPDVGTLGAFRAALLAAPSFAYADPARGATAGAHMARIFDQLGIAEAMRAKSRLVPFGVDGVSLAAAGEVALAASQASEIIGRPGVALVGMLPDALQLWTRYGVAALRDAAEPAPLLDLFTSPAARAAFTAIGFVPS